MQGDVHDGEAVDKNNSPVPTPSAKGEMTHDDNLKALAASVAGIEQEGIKATA